MANVQKNAERQNDAAATFNAVCADRRRGRGAISNISGRFEALSRSAEDDGWDSLDDLPPFRTQVQEEKARKIITFNDSPDISFDRSINPYRGCEHGCVYCYARPSHAYMGLSPGLDFESRLFAKPDAARLLEKELAAAGYSPRTIAMGTNTDPYQPVERQRRITRSILEVLEHCNHPVGLVTKSALVARDIDILAGMAQKDLAKVAISITSLDAGLSRSLEPRAATPSLRLKTVSRLAEAGIPVCVMVAPVIPHINDAEIERILAAARDAGASEAGYVMLRLPREVEGLMREWLAEHRPDALNHVFSLLRSVRQGKEYDARWGLRMRGTGPYAWITGRRFELAATKLGLNKRRHKLRTDLFTPPRPARAQLSLF